MADFGFDKRYIRDGLTIATQDGLTTKHNPIHFEVSNGTLTVNADGSVYIDTSGGGSGSGTVDTGNITELAFYPSTGTTVEGQGNLKYNTTNDYLELAGGASDVVDLYFTSSTPAATTNGTIVWDSFSPSPADGDVIGKMIFAGHDSANAASPTTNTSYGVIWSKSALVTDTTQTGEMLFQNLDGNTAFYPLRLYGKKSYMSTNSTYADTPSTSTEVLHVKGTGSIVGEQDTILVETVTGTYPTKMKIYTNDSTPSSGDVLGIISFTGNDSTSAETEFSKIHAVSADTTNGSEIGETTFENLNSGSSVYPLKLYGKKTFITTDAAFTDTPRSNVEVLHVRGTGSAAGQPDMVMIESSDTAASSEPNLVFHRQIAVDGTVRDYGKIIFRARNGADSADVNYITLATATDPQETSLGEMQQLTLDIATSTSATRELIIFNKGEDAATDELNMVGNYGGDDYGLVWNNANNNALLNVRAKTPTTNIGQVRINSGSVDTTDSDNGIRFSVNGAARHLLNVVTLATSTPINGAQYQSGDVLVFSQNSQVINLPIGTVGANMHFINPGFTGCQISPTGGAKINNTTSNYNVDAWYNTQAINIDGANWLFGRLEY